MFRIQAPRAGCGSTPVPVPLTTQRKPTCNHQSAKSADIILSHSNMHESLWPKVTLPGCETKVLLGLYKVNHHKILSATEQTHERIVIERQNKHWFCFGAASSAISPDAVINIGERLTGLVNKLCHIRTKVGDCRPLWVWGKIKFAPVWKHAPCSLEMLTEFDGSTVGSLFLLHRLDFKFCHQKTLQVASRYLWKSAPKQGAMKTWCLSPFEKISFHVEPSFRSQKYTIKTSLRRTLPIVVWCDCICMNRKIKGRNKSEAKLRARKSKCFFCVGQKCFFSSQQGETKVQDEKEVWICGTL